MIINIIKLILTAGIMVIPVVVLLVGILLLVIYMILKKEIHDWWLGRFKKGGEGAKKQ